MKDLLGFFDRVLDTPEWARGENRRRLVERGRRLERAAEGSDQVRSALAEDRAEENPPARNLLPSAVQAGAN